MAGSTEFWVFVDSSSSSTTLDLTTRDGQNNPIYGSGHYVTLKLSGPGSFEPTSGGAAPVTSETQFVHSSSGTYPVTVYGIEGQPGTVTVTASSSGLTGASVDVPSYVIGAPAALSVSSTVESGTSGAYTQYTVDVLDANGHVIPGNSNTISATVKSGASGVVAMSSTSSFTNSSSATVTATAGNGVATFDVKTKTVGTGPATLAITDSSHSSIPTVDTTYSYSKRQTLPAFPELLGSLIIAPKSVKGVFHHEPKGTRRTAPALGGIGGRISRERARTGPMVPTERA